MRTASPHAPGSGCGASQMPSSLVNAMTWAFGWMTGPTVASVKEHVAPVGCASGAPASWRITMPVPPFVQTPRVKSALTSPSVGRLAASANQSTASVAAAMFATSAAAPPGAVDGRCTSSWPLASQAGRTSPG